MNTCHCIMHHGDNVLSSVLADQSIMIHNLHVIIPLNLVLLTNPMIQTFCSYWIPQAFLPCVWITSVTWASRSFSCGGHEHHNIDAYIRTCWWSGLDDFVPEHAVLSWLLWLFWHFWLVKTNNLTLKTLCESTSYVIISFFK
jgi:hypothetical protein